MPFSLTPPRIKPWVRLAYERVGSYRVFDVMRAEMRAPAPDGGADGKGGVTVPHPIYTFACPTWCNVLAITKDDEAVLVWQYRHGTNKMSLELPGGVSDANEAPLECARRELREETGYGAESYELLGTFDPNPALQGNLHHTFLARGAKLAGPTAFDPTEECEVALVPVRELGQMIDEGHISHALCIVGIERYLRHGRA